MANGQPPFARHAPTHTAGTIVFRTFINPRAGHVEEKRPDLGGHTPKFPQIPGLGRNLSSNHSPTTPYHLPLAT